MTNDELRKKVGDAVRGVGFILTEEIIDAILRVIVPEIAERCAGVTQDFISEKRQPNCSDMRQGIAAAIREKAKKWVSTEEKEQQ